MRCLQPFQKLLHFTSVIGLLFFSTTTFGQTAVPSTQPAGTSVMPTTLPATQPATQPAHPATRPINAIDRVVIISVDGLRPDLLLRAKTPHIHHMIEQGSFSFWARTTAISITLPSHVSMLTGVSPNRHQILWNMDLPLLRPVYPAVPTLFELGHRYGYTTGMVAGKSKFSVLNKPNTIDWAFIPAEIKTEDVDVAKQAVSMIRAHKPQVMFIHLPSVDNAGHKYGWGTAEQMAAIENADTAVGKIMKTLRKRELLDSTAIILTADHGGAGRTHGPDDPRSRHIPWIIVGPGIRKDLDLTTYPNLEINTEDTFATACWLLGIPMDVKIVEGKPIEEVMIRAELLQPTR